MDDSDPPRDSGGWNVLAFEWVLRRVPAEASVEAFGLLDALVEVGVLVRVDTPTGPCYELEEGLTLEVALAAARAYLRVIRGEDA